MKAVLDTNILISATLWRGNPWRCVLAAEAGLFELVVADPILEELRRKLEEKSGHTPEEAAEVADRFRTLGDCVSLQGRGGWITDDPDDDKFVEAAIVSRADAIVSGDRHLLGPGKIEGIEVLSAAQFVSRLARPNR